MLTRKPMTALVACDFKDSPAWELLDSDGDGAEVQEMRLPRRNHDHYLVAATATVCDGSTHPAFVAISHHGSQALVGALTLFIGAEQRYVQASDPACQFRVSEADAALLPITWSLNMALDGEAEPRRGTVSGSAFGNFFKRIAYQTKLQKAQAEVRGSD